MPRYGNRWLWSPIELQRVVKYLRAHFGNGVAINRKDLERAALAVCGRTSAARVMRDRLVAADCLAFETSRRGRGAAYTLAPNAEDCIAIAEPIPDGGGQRNGGALMVLGCILRFTLDYL
jgi:hypothetical protein